MRRFSISSPLPFSPSPPRSGFTLVEILLSLALLMLVMTVALSGLVLFQNVTVAGRAQAERAQLARAIERRMAADIRCVLFREQEPVVEEEEEDSSAGLAVMNENVGAADDSGGTTEASETEDSTGTGTSTSSSSSETTESTTSTPSDAYATQSMGVFGNATTLVLHVSKPSRESAQAIGAMDDAAMMEPISRASDLRSISYFLAVAGGGGLQGAVGNTAAGGTAMFAMEQGAQGLARLDGDRLMIQQADATGGVALLAQQAEVLAPEVTELQFRYFDGVGWLTTWDSVAMNALPRAIEVTLRIDLGEDVEESALLEEASEGTSSSSDVYRFVVALPLSDPTLGMAL